MLGFEPWTSWLEGEHTTIHHISLPPWRQGFPCIGQMVEIIADNDDGIGQMIETIAGNAEGSLLMKT